MEEAQNLRSNERIRAFLRAQIIFNNRMSTIDCIIKNISPTGARIALNAELTVPTEFEVYIPQRGRSHHARLVWRDKDAIGVDFTDAQAPAAAASTSEPQPAATEARLRELEAENAELKVRVRTLRGRLENLGQDPDLGK